MQKIWIFLFTSLPILIILSSNSLAFEVSSSASSTPLNPLCTYEYYAGGGFFEDQLRRVKSYANEDGEFGFTAFSCSILANSLQTLSSQSSMCADYIPESRLSYFKSLFNDALSIYNAECPKCRKIRPFGEKKPCEIKADQFNDVDLEKCVYKIKCPKDYQCYNQCTSSTQFSQSSVNNLCIKNDNNDSNKCLFFQEVDGKRKKLDANKFINDCFAKGSRNFYFTYDTGPGGTGNILGAVCVGVNSISCTYKDLDTLEISCVADGLNKNESKNKCEGFVGEISNNGIWDNNSNSCKLTLTDYNYDSMQRDRDKANRSICSYYNLGSFLCVGVPGKSDWKVAVNEPNSCVNKKDNPVDINESGFLSDGNYRCVYNKSAPQSTWPTRENVCTYLITIPCPNNPDSNEVKSRCEERNGIFNFASNSCTIKSKFPYGSMGLLSVAICQSCSGSFLSKAAKDIKTLSDNLTNQADNFKQSFDGLVDCNVKASILMQQLMPLRSILDFINGRINFLIDYKNQNNLGGACSTKADNLANDLRNLSSSLVSKFNAIVASHNSSCLANQVPTIS